MDRIYYASGKLAAIFLFLIFLTIIAQVGLNALDRAIGLVLGQPIGLSIPSYADFAGYFLAATSFLGLASTLRHGDLIRVSLLIDRLPSKIRYYFELWSYAFGAAISLFATWYAVLLAIESWQYNDMSTGVIAIPIWIPQLSMIVGLALLAVAFIDSFGSILRNGTVPFENKSKGLNDISQSESDR